MICSNTNAFAASYNLGDESVQSHISSSTNLGTLSYWYSNTDIISHWKTPRKIYVSNLSSNSSFDLGYYVGFAIYQWSSKAQISCSANGTENSHSIVMEDLKAILQMQEFLVIVQVLMENAEVLRQLKEPIHMVV